ncbi:uncharacterized protein LOC141660144 [Apium graveolens]|uniref:uncharacterized protein LOC141660144 n=1 Tax=Apium graveolens TaxID=4045 RepID=UPI003D7935D2
MSSQKIGGFKVPKFDKANYNLWKKRMLLYLRAADHRYIKVIEKGPFVFEIEDPNDDKKRIPKNPDDYTEKDIELDSLDAKVQHLLMESMDDDMSHQTAVCENAKHMWQTIELLMEGTEDVRENRLDILTTQYEAFKSLPGENITSVFERLNKLINELSIYGKRYEQKEINRKFMLTLPTHLISKGDSKKIIFGSGAVDVKNAELLKTTALEASKHKDLDITAEKPKTNDQVLCDAEVDDGNLSGDPRDYYTMEELQDMKDPTMANMAAIFGNLRFRRKQAFRGSGSSNRGHKSPSYSDSGYKTWMVDRKNVKCFNCGEMGHFATECKRSQQARDKGKTYQKKDYGGSKKYPVKSYIAEGRSWDDTDDEEEQFGNMALMADTLHSSRQVILCSYSPPFHTENLCENEHYLAFRKSITIPAASSFDSIKVECTEKVCIDRYNSINLSYYHCIVSLKNANGTVGDLKEKANNHVETIAQRDEKIKELEAKLQAYANSANLAKELISSQVVSGKLGIGLDYDELKSQGIKQNKVIWILDSGCSRHITGDRALLLKVVKKAGPKVTFGDDRKGYTTGYGCLEIGNVIIEDISLVEGLIHNLLSISQFCDKGCEVSKQKNEKITLNGVRKGDLFVADWNSAGDGQRELVRGLPEMEFFPEGLCEACEKGKSKRASHKKKIVSDIAEPLQLLHMDLFGPVNDEAAEMIIDHINKIELEVGVPVRCIRSDNGTEFRNAKLNDFYVEKGISRQYSAPRTPQQNGVVERKNRTLVQAARTMLNETNLPTYFWAEAKPFVSYFHVFGGKYYVLKDDEHLGKFDAKVEEGIFLGYSLESKAYRVFVIDDSKVVESLNVTFDDTKLPSIQKEDSNDHLSVEDLSDDEDEPEFVPNRDSNGDGHHNDHNGDSDSDGNGGDGSDMNGNSGNTIVHSETVSGTSPQVSGSTDQNGSNSGGVEQERGSDSRTQQNVNQVESSRENFPRAVKWSISHPEDLIIGDAGARVQTRRSTANECLFSGFLSQMEPKKYIRDLLKKYQMEDSTPAKTPMSTATKLDQDESGKKVDITHYRGMIGSLLYLTASLPDIMFVTCLCARFQADPKESHLIAVKRIFRYLKGTPNLGIWYPKDTSFDLIGYMDSDYAGCSDEEKPLRILSEFKLAIGWTIADLKGISLGDYVDISRIIHRGILRFLRGSTTGSIPYASIVTRLCAAVRVRWTTHEQLQLPSVAIDSSTILHMVEWYGGKPDPKGLGYSFDMLSGKRPADQYYDGGSKKARETGWRAQLGEEIEPSQIKEPSKKSNTQYRHLVRRMDAMHDIHSRFTRDLTQALGTALEPPVLISSGQFFVRISCIHLRTHLTLHLLRVRSLILIRYS